MCNSNKRNKYNDEPVHFCSNCLSIKIKEIGENTNFYACLDCGCTDIEEDDLEEWVRLYSSKYGKPFFSLEEEMDMLNEEDCILEDIDGDIDIEDIDDFGELDNY